ncbi:MAG: FAD-dependent oxidoreductase [Tissierellia bacterium]|nr:FAD-dependent oxidoreductase [Tissierellia bacterium]
MKLLVVGAVAGGSSVAARVRRLDEKAEIIVLEKGPHPSYSNCCLPNFLSRDVKSSDSLLLNSPEKFKKNNNIDVRVNNEVIKIDPKEKKVLIKDLLKDKEYEESYDKLVLSQGSHAIMPKSIKGIDKKHVFSLKNVVDVRKIDSYIEENDIKDIAVIGGGFIGLEVMENLKRRGKNVTLVEAMDQVMAPIDYDMAQIAHKEIIDNGVELILEDSASEITDDKLILSSGKKIDAKAVIVSIGVSPNTKFLKDSGIELTDKGQIKVDHNYRTNVKDIYAIGDAIQTFNSITGQKQVLALAGPAQKQARDLADYICGRRILNNGVIGSSVVKLFDLNIASTGLNEKDLNKLGIDYRYSYIIASDKVGIMPNSKPMHFKLLFSYPDGKILGAQALGKGEVDKRINVVATAIHFNGTLEDLKDLELAYAPAFSTAKDVVNQAALVGLNILNEEYKQVPVTKVRELVENKAYIIDVREEGEYNNSHLITAKNIPLSQLRKRIDEVPKDKPVYLHCRSSQRSYYATRILQGHGYDNIYNIQGSFLGISLYEYYNDITKKREKILTDYNFN